MNDPNNQVELTINVYIRQPHGGSGQLQINQTISIPQASFLEMCQILGQFNELAEKVKRQAEVKK